MKRYSYIVIFYIGLMSYLFGSDKISTGSEFWLSAEDANILKKSMLVSGDASAALKLSSYYFFSINDGNRGLCCLFVSAKLGDKKSAEALENYYKISPKSNSRIFLNFENELARLRANKDIFSQYILYGYYISKRMTDESDRCKKFLEGKKVAKKLLEIEDILK